MKLMHQRYLEIMSEFLNSEGIWREFRIPHKIIYYQKEYNLAKIERRQILKKREKVVKQMEQYEIKLGCAMISRLINIESRMDQIP